MSTPGPGGSYISQTATTPYDYMGRAWKVTLPDGTSTTNEFWVTGLLKKTLGSRTYPVEYTYRANSPLVSNVRVRHGRHNRVVQTERYELLVNSQN